MPMQKGAASCMSVEAPRAKATMPTRGGGDEGGVEVASGAETPHVEENKDRSEGEAPVVDGRRADQSETPNSLKKLMARQ